jgi:hypothetical protein
MRCLWMPALGAVPDMQFDPWMRFNGIGGRSGHGNHPRHSSSVKNSPATTPPSGEKLMTGLKLIVAAYFAILAMIVTAGVAVLSIEDIAASQHSALDNHQ